MIEYPDNLLPTLSIMIKHIWSQFTLYSRLSSYVCLVANTNQPYNIHSDQQLLVTVLKISTRLPL